MCQYSAGSVRYRLHSRYSPPVFQQTRSLQRRQVPMLQCSSHNSSAGFVRNPMRGGMQATFLLLFRVAMWQVKIGIFNMIGISLYNVHNCLHKSKNPLRLKVKGSYFQAVYLSVVNGERTLFSFIFYEKRISLSIEIITKNKFKILYPLLNKKHSRQH